MTGLTDFHSPSFVIPTQKPLGFDEESPVYTTQSSEAQSTYSRSSRRSFHSLLRMTSLTNCHSSDTVIPTERGTSDEESRVCASKSSRTQSIYCRSSRRFASQDDSINGLMAPLRMTDLEDCNFEIYITIPLRMTSLREERYLNPCHSDRATEWSDEESLVCTL